MSVPLLDLSADREFPGPVYLCLHHKMVKYRNKGDALDAEAFNKLVYNRVKFVFIDEQDRGGFEKWVTESEEADVASSRPVVDNPETRQIAEAAGEQRRAMMDIFVAPRDDKQVRAAVDTSKKLVTEFLRKPFAVNNIQAMQKHGKGVVDHSVNVSVMSVFLGLRMGYSHQLILENLALGGLFHDIGKVLIETKTDGMTSEDDPAMQQHPKLGAEMLDKMKEIPSEVRMIVAQHHEFLDGSGYPARLKGLAVYDLARLVSIANVYDNLVSESGRETIKERAEDALAQLEKTYENKLDPKKLEKVLKILKYSLL